MTDRPDRSEVPKASEEVEGPVDLRGGLRGEVRRLVAADRPLLEEFVRGLSETSLAVRFFAPVPPSTALAELARGVDADDRFALLLTVRETGSPRAVAHAELARDAVDSPSAEVSFLVADAYQGRGCATALLWRLARAARRMGISEFHASVLMENDQMLEVFRGSGFPIEEWWGPDAVQVSFPIGARFEPPSPRPDDRSAHL